MLGALIGVLATPADAAVLFSRHSGVPWPVQEFAWRVIETHCDYQGYERSLRSFWAYDTRAEPRDGRTVYSIKVIADVTWRKREPPAVIEMTLVDEGGVQLAALRSSFITCAP
jgi:hypothetical protein